MSTQTVPPHQSPLAIQWILNRRLDLLLFVGTPVLIVPALLLAGRKWSHEDLFLIVSAFGALGHHAPGLMRAYGDRQLFRRFRLRFTIVPVVAITIFCLYPLDELPAATLLLLTWGLWHFLMQTYGFARIYDSKVRSFHLLTQRLDFALCVSWSATCILFADSRMKEFLSLCLDSGLTFVLHIPLPQLRAISLAITIVVTVLFLGNAIHRGLQGEPVNVVKLILFATTFAFFWWCAVSLTNLILGVAMFELFHDIQYLGIVWLFNKNRAEKDPEVGMFTRLLFRPGSGLVGVYIGLIAAYGFIGIAAERIATDTLQRVLFGVIATSNLLHFYYDGFIWKLREPETRSAVGLATGGGSVGRLTQGLGHAAKWAVVLALVGGARLAERHSTMTDLEKAQAIAQRVPESVSALNDLAKVNLDMGNDLEAIDVGNAAKKLNADRYRTHMYLGVALTNVGRETSGFRELERAFEMNDRDAYLRFHLAMGCIRRNRLDEAMTHLKAAVKLAPGDPVARYNLGALQLMLQQPDKAIESWQQTVAIQPDHAAAHRHLGETFLDRHQQKEASRHLKKAVDLNPDDVQGWVLLARCYAESGDTAEAVAAANEGAKRARAGGQPELALELEAMSDDLAEADSSKTASE